MYVDICTSADEKIALTSLLLYMPLGILSVKSYA